MVLLAWACVLTVQAGELRILTTEVPPLAFTRDGQVTGFCVEVVKAIQQRLGERTPIEVMPWTRAYQIGLSAPNVVLVCPKRTAERENLFKWVGPLLESRTSFYARAGSGIRLASLDEAKQASGILIPRTFYSYTYLKGEGFTNLVAAETSLTAMLMLLAGRQPLLAIDEVQVADLLVRAQVDERAVERVLRAAPAISYLSFSRALPDDLVARWQAELERMKGDGSFARLQKEWLGH
ncbi:hypothetical protein A9179_14935 [Pseudomonas alcaligenes]|uniref:Solute-binding protein family 3/N-terminal domain-containing protein n=2 Tax=Aquipseudomonas alcaligenes TaxID=43263 RepID=A0ABR7S425_AQUAC|nr:hypothetical protein [Pseudomonas alcaligenes]